MRALIFSDLHFLVEPVLLPGVPERALFQAETCNWIAEMIREARPQVVVNLGDTNHRQGMVDVATLALTMRCLRTIQTAAADVGAVMVHVKGNHDRYDDLGLDTVLEAFPDYGGLRVAPAVLKVITQETYLDWAKIGFIPYISAKDPHSFVERVEGLAQAGVEVLFVHQDIMGARWMPGVIEEGGIGQRIFEPFKLVVGGHYHHPQWVDKDRRIRIVGSPYYLNFSDHWVSEESARGCLVIDGLAEDVALTCQMVENPHTPIRHTVEAEDVGVIERTFAAVGAQRLPRLVLRVKCRSADLLAELRERLPAYRQHVMWLGLVDATTGQPSAPDAGIVMAADARPDDVVRDHVERSSTSLDRERLVETGLRFLGGA